jgi:class 3 adenylate cyclase
MVEPEALPPEPAVVADRASQLDALRSIATAFADEATAVLARARPKLPASERFALNLYLHGGVQGAALHHDLDEQTARDVTHTILERTGLSAPDVAAYFADLEGASERPRYRRMMDEGRLAIAAMFGHETRAASQSIVDLLIRWSDPAGNQAAEPQQMTFLLTDIVGSTALTSQIGNAGAQRVVRAHNAVARAAAKAFRGREIKHTGDGMLIMFPDSTAGVRAAIDIQQEAFGYTQDNPTAPLVLRVGLHTGEAVVEDGEYYGSGVTLATAACALAEPNEICCTQTIRNKVPSTFRFEEMGARTLKGSAEPVPMHRALWEPKRSASKSVLEYRQIGTTPSPPAGDTK